MELLVELAVAAAVVGAAALVFALLMGSIPGTFRPPLWWWRHTLQRQGNVRTAVAAGTTTLLGAAILAVVYAFVSNRAIGFLGLDARCQTTPLGCNVITEVVVTVFVALAAVTWFFVWRRWRIAGYYRKRARTDTEKLFRAAMAADDVAPRDTLLKSIAEDICRTEHRRPQVVLGGVGSGKTATVVELTKWLADRGAVPVPLELRDVEDDLDLFDLARAKFLDNVEDKLLNEDQGDRVWRKLCADGSIVVLGDALDAALPSLKEHEQQWRERVRYAIESAQPRLPLVLTSRARRGLEGLDVAFVPLETLDEDEAIAVVRKRNEKTLDEAGEAALRDFTRDAQLAETPFFLKVAGDLHEIDALLPRPTGSGRSTLRVKLLDRWIDAVVSGKLGRESELLTAERQRVVEQLEAVAFHALRVNVHRVDVRDITPADYDVVGRKVSDEWDPSLIASGAAHLGLAEQVGPGKIEFRHSILEAYFASRRLVALLKQKGDEVVRPLAARSARDGFMALTMAVARDETSNLEAQLVIEFEITLAEAAQGDAKLWLATAAADAVQAAGPGVIGNSEVRRISQAVGDSAGRTAQWLPKIRVIPRLSRLGGTEAYEALWKLCQDDSYAVRLSAAITLAEGGSKAYAYLRRAIVGTATQKAYDIENGHSSREVLLQGWIMPTLETTVDEPFATEAEQIVDIWAGLVGDGLDPAMEASLAKGFKLEATRIVDEGTAAVRDRRWPTLLDILPRARFWYSRVMLIQAMCLRAIADESREAEANALLKRSVLEDEHPFVRATASACLDALNSDRDLPLRDRDASSHVWFDETALVGTAPASYSAGFAQGAGSPIGRLPTATNWRVLGDSTFQLVADVVLLLNLIEQGDEAQRDQRLARVCEPAVAARVPHCLLESPGRAALHVDSLTPPATSECPAACGLKLCPYPTRAKGPYRGEISEPFCRRQRQLLHAPFSRPRWQRAPRRHLREFWHRMERRASP